MGIIPQCRLRTMVRPPIGRLSQDPSGSLFLGKNQQVCEILHKLPKQGRGGPIARIFRKFNGRFKLPENFDNGIKSTKMAQANICSVFEKSRKIFRHFFKKNSHQLIISYFHMFCQHEFLYNHMNIIFIFCIFNTLHNYTHLTKKHDAHFMHRVND